MFQSRRVNLGVFGRDDDLELEFGVADLSQGLIDELEIPGLDSLARQGIGNLEHETDLVAVDGHGIGEGGEPHGLVQLLAENSDHRFPQTLLLDHQEPHVFPLPLDHDRSDLRFSNSASELTTTM